MALARELLAGIRGHRLPRGPRPATSANRTGLGGREQQVLKLVAAGCSNGKIASQLFLWPKTVERHLTR